MPAADVQYPSDANGFYWYAVRQLPVDVVLVDDGTAPDTETTPDAPTSVTVGTVQRVAVPASSDAGGMLVYGPYIVDSGAPRNRGEWWVIATPNPIGAHIDGYDVTRFVEDGNLPTGWIRSAVDEGQASS